MDFFADGLTRFLPLRYVVCMSSTVIGVWDKIEHGSGTELESRAIPKWRARICCACPLHQLGCAYRVIDNHTAQVTSIAFGVVLSLSLLNFLPVEGWTRHPFSSSYHYHLL